MALKKKRGLLEARVDAADAERAGQPVVITIARDFGAEGHEIGKMLANELGIPLYDNELLVRSSMRAEEAMDKMAAYDERPPRAASSRAGFLTTCSGRTPTTSPCW